MASCPSIMSEPERGRNKRLRAVAFQPHATLKCKLQKRIRGSWYNLTAWSPAKSFTSPRSSYVQEGDGMGMQRSLRAGAIA